MTSFRNLFAAIWCSFAKLQLRPGELDGEKHDAVDGGISLKSEDLEAEFMHEEVSEFKQRLILRLHHYIVGN